MINKITPEHVAVIKLKMLLLYPDAKMNFPVDRYCQTQWTIGNHITIYIDNDTCSVWDNRLSGNIAHHGTTYEEFLILMEHLEC